MMGRAKRRSGPPANIADDASLNVTVLSSLEELEAVAGEWDAFVERCGSDIYFTSDWLAVWWDHYGNGRNFHALVIRDKQDMVAALPFAIEDMGLVPFRVRLARFVGADSTIPVFFPAIAESYEKVVASVVFDDLLNEQKCDLVSFSPLSGASAFADAISAELLLREGSRDHALVRDDSAGLHTLFILPADFEIYLKSLSAKNRSNYRRYLRSLTERYALSSRVEKGPGANARFDAFVALHQDQWKAIGQLGHFGDWPDSLDFNRALIARLAPKGQVRFYELWGGEDLLASQFCFVLSDRCFARLPARKLDPALNKLGLGTINQIEMLEALIREKVLHVESGPGHYGYKVSYGGTEFQLRRLIVCRATLLSRSRARVLLAWADLIHFVYYRFWFLKLARRFGLHRRPLWRAWTRTRL